MESPARRRVSPARAGGRVLATLAGCRHPVVVVLLLIAFFAAISGKPLDGVLMLAVAVPLAYDSGRPAAPGAAPAPAAPAGGAPAPGAPAAGAFSPAPGRTARRRALPAAAGLAGGLLYAVAVGSFTRYSWPVTLAVVSVGALVVARGWRGPVVQRPDPGPLPRAGAGMWGAVLAAGGLWELSALLQQPALTASSYDHPTISTLTDPLLAGSPGRALVLAAWLALGWALMRR